LPAVASLLPSLSVRLKHCEVFFFQSRSPPGPTPGDVKSSLFFPFPCSLSSFCCIATLFQNIFLFQHYWYISFFSERLLFGAPLWNTGTFPCLCGTPPGFSSGAAFLRHPQLFLYLIFSWFSLFLFSIICRASPCPVLFLSCAHKVHTPEFSYRVSTYLTSSVGRPALSLFGRRLCT